MLALACLPLAGCILNPTNRGNVQSSSITLEGYAAGGGSTVKLTARDLNSTNGSMDVLFLLLADAGVRPGEGCAVKWSDFDPVARTLGVERAVTKTGRIKGVKTGEDRDVDLQ